MFTKVVGDWLRSFPVIMAHASVVLVVDNGDKVTGFRHRQTLV